MTAPAPAPNTNPQPDPTADLAAILHGRIRKSGWLAWRMNARLVLTQFALVVGIALTPLGLYFAFFPGKGAGPEPAGGVTCFAVFFALVALLVQVKLFRIFNTSIGAEQFSQSALRPYERGEKDRAGLWRVIDELTVAMGLGSDRIAVHVSTRNGSFGPSIVELHPDIPRNVMLVVPLGWFKVLRATPDVARAMLAHELGHVLNKDSNRWLLAKTYRRAIGWIVLLSVINGLSILADSLLTFQRTGTGMRNSGGSPVTVCLTFLYATFLYPYILLSHVWFIRRSLRFSEETADCCAAVHVGEAATRGYLDLCVTHSSGSDAHDDHPPPKWRLSRLAERYRRRSPIGGRVAAVLYTALHCGVILLLANRSRDPIPPHEVSPQLLGGLAVGIIFFCLGWLWDRADV